jgi:hypothetical protein
MSFINQSFCNVTVMTLTYEDYYTEKLNNIITVLELIRKEANTWLLQRKIQQEKNKVLNRELFSYKTTTF